MTNEKAIAILERKTTIPSDGYTWEEIEEAISMAIRALHDPVCQAATWELTRELAEREGVETHTAEPYQDVSITVNGPAVVLVVTD